jgi:hypothetical protein
MMKSAAGVDVDEPEPMEYGWDSDRLKISMRKTMENVHTRTKTDIVKALTKKKKHAATETIEEFIEPADYYHVQSQQSLTS